MNVAIRWKSASVSQNIMNREDLSITIAISLKPRVLCEQNGNFLPKGLTGIYFGEPGLLMRLTNIKS